MQYQRSNPINEAIKTYAAVDGLFRADRQEAAQAEDRKLMRSNQTEHLQLAKNADARSQDDADYQAKTRERQELILQLKSEEAGNIGPDAADYLDPEVRAAHRPWLEAAAGKLRNGDMDHDFFLDYFNTIHSNQLNKGSGGKSKRLSRIGIDPENEGHLIFGLDVEQEDGSVAKKMMTKNRLTVQEGDTELKRVPMQTLIQDMTKRMTLLDAFDQEGVGEGETIEENKQRAQAAQKNFLQMRIAAGDPDAWKEHENKKSGQRLQAIVAEIPEGTPARQAIQTITAKAIAENIPADMIKSITDTYAGKEVARITDEQALPGDMIQDVESFDGGKTWKPFGVARKRWQPKEGDGDGTKIDPQARLNSESAVKAANGLWAAHLIRTYGLNSKELSSEAQDAVQQFMQSGSTGDPYSGATSMARLVSAGVVPKEVADQYRQSLSLAANHANEGDLPQVAADRAMPFRNTVKRNEAIPAPATRQTEKPAPDILLSEARAKMGTLKTDAAKAKLRQAVDQYYPGLSKQL